ncbi:MAG TPA: hypothetical protein VEZ48_06265 [Sphingomonadaceae bacterium]|nr:hypothetical protein [Sphingomonadaceae bacterium]
MPLTLAQANGWSLATTLMVSVVLIATPNGYTVMPTTDFDGDPASVVHEYDPFAP